MFIAAIIFAYLMLVIGTAWVLFGRSREEYLLKITCNNLIVLHTQLIELEGLCDISKTQSVSWQFFPPAPEGQPENVVKVEVIRA